jgi:hypothetical protein
MNDKKEAMMSWDKEDKRVHQVLTQRLPDDISMELQDLRTTKER